MARGARFAKGREPGRDAAGRSLPSDKSMLYVELQLVCKAHPVGEQPILGAWWIDSTLAAFDASQVNERRNAAVATQLPDASGRQRYQMQCPKCPNAPVYRQERIDAALAAVFEHGVYQRVVRHPV